MDSAKQPPSTSSHHSPDCLAVPCRVLRLSLCFLVSLLYLNWRMACSFSWIMKSMNYIADAFSRASVDDRIWRIVSDSVDIENSKMNRTKKNKYHKNRISLSITYLFACMRPIMSGQFI